jgi:hypothetical protein
MNDPICANCEFYQSDVVGTDKVDGRGACYRFPPTFIGCRPDQAGDPERWLNPVVWECGWCGEYSDKEVS